MAPQLDTQRPAAGTAGEIARAGWNLIGGRWLAGGGARTRPVRNPADTTQLLCGVREASAEQVDDCCAAADRAFAAWRATPPADRARVLFRYRELLEQHFEELAELIVAENGKLLSEARGS